MTDRCGLIFWFTGLSGAGKSTLAEAARHVLIHDHGLDVGLLDGDEVRRQRHAHLGFTERDIKENNARIADLCGMLRRDHDLVMVPIISPYAESRQTARAALSPGFFEIYIKADIETLERRDTKGLYAKARDGVIDNLIGYSSATPYEPPESPDLVLDTGVEDVTTSAARLVALATVRHSHTSAHTNA